MGRVHALARRGSKGSLRTRPRPILRKRPQRRVADQCRARPPCTGDHTMSQSYLRGIYLRLAGVVMLVVVLALGASVVMSHRVFERALAPEMSKKVATIGASVRSLVLNAVGHRIKFGELHGIDQKFDEIKHEVPEIAYFAVTDTHGAVLHQRFDAPVGAAAYFQKPSVLSALSKPDTVPPAVRVSDQYIVSLPIISAQGPLGMLHI